MALALASVAVFLLLAEASLRVVGQADERPTGYAPVNTRRRDRRPTNSLGYRDVERALSKPAGVRRVVSLGDSFAWGVGIEHDDTYARRVERVLNRRPGEHWEVVQLARPGMGTVEQAEQLAEEGFAYEPDVVVLGFVLNDSEDENAAEARRARDWEETRRERQERRTGRRFLDRSALWRFVAGRLEATGQNQRRLEAYRSQFLPGYPGWAACRAGLARMGALCRERHVPFVVMIFPLFADPLDERYPFADIHAQVAQAAREAGAEVIDLLPAYRNLRSSLLVVDGANDEHPNEIAHRIAAQELLRTLDRLFPPSPR
ncbi:MAG TPA: SGNH/GDSL hydrolase family protein [Vicinamibacteria bacterium]|nr:SGNH/GDSL hydrolase family protein [Vicinamibacteria bacterium]